MAWWGGDDDDGGGGIAGGIKSAAKTYYSGGVLDQASGVPGVSQVKKGISGTLGFDNSKQKGMMDDSAAMSEEEARQNRGVLDRMKQEDDEYLASSGHASKDYMDNLIRLRDDAVTQAADARKVYSNDIQPRMKNVMEDAERNANQAMSLSDAGDVNNSVQRGVRGLYDQYAQGIQNQATADYGVLSALGAQATQNTMGSAGPMTGAQMQLLNAGNQQQAGLAYQKAQQRMQSLREQGIARGFEESDRQYQRGQQAKDRYSQSIGAYEGAMNRNIDREQRFRDINEDYAAKRFAAQRGQLTDRLNVRQGGNNRDLAQIGAEYGNRQAQIANQINAANAENASKRGILGGIITAGATGAGAYMGGAQGAQAGAMAGNGIAGGMNQGYYDYQTPNRAPQRYSYTG